MSKLKEAIEYFRVAITESIEPTMVDEAIPALLRRAAEYVVAHYEKKPECTYVIDTYDINVTRNASNKIATISFNAIFEIHFDKQVHVNEFVQVVSLTASTEKMGPIHRFDGDSK